MTGIILVAIAVLAIAVGLFVFRAIPAVKAYFGYRGKRLVTCPETHKTEAVDVAAGEAAVSAFLSDPALHLKQCSRWPKRENCDQDCLQQIEADPENCLVWNVVSQWYQGKVVCNATPTAVSPLTTCDVDHNRARFLERSSPLTNVIEITNSCDVKYGLKSLLRRESITYRS